MTQRTPSLLACAQALACLVAGFAAVPVQAELLPTSPGLHAPNHFSFDGHWTCVGAFPNGKVHRSDYQGRGLFGGALIQLQEIDTQPAGYKGIYNIGYDAYGKRLVLLQSTNEGSVAYASDDGWQGNTITYTALPAFRKPTGSRFMFQVDSPTRFEVTWQQNVSGTWTTGDHLSCDHVVEGKSSRPQG